MFADDVKYLKCIECNGNFNVEAFLRENSEVKEGLLVCRGCKKEFPIINFIPRIFSDDLMTSLVVPHYPEFFESLEAGHYHEKKKSRKHLTKEDKAADKLKKKTASTFGFEWLKYPKILKQFENDWGRYFNPFITKKDIKGKVVADFGCGMAKHGYFIGKYKAKKYIGLDLSLAVEATYRNTKKNRPLIVQADIYAPPLQGEEIDIFYSIGVLHHLPYPEAGFLSITSLMKKKDAKILIWVYGKNKNARALMLYNPIRVVTTKMPKSILYPLCHIPAVITHSINAVQKGLEHAGLGSVAKKLPFHYYKDFPYTFKVSDSYDVFGTPKQVYYEKRDIDKWFRHAKIKEYTLEYDIVQGIKGYGTK
jgi:uncharacterized protein YbaR (Trm112 family)